MSHDVRHRKRADRFPTDRGGRARRSRECSARVRVGEAWSRQTVYNWLEAGKLLGWRKTKARRYIPAEQILGPGHVVPGREDVLTEIEDPEIAWAFLTQDRPFEETTARPIALLKAGRVAVVVGAAKGYGASAT